MGCHGSKGSATDYDSATRIDVSTGIDVSTKEKASGENSVIGLKDFELIGMIDKRSHDKVLLVNQKLTKRVYAMKVIKKETVNDDENTGCIQTEKRVFETASSHPFLLGLHYCFQTPSRLFFVTDFMNGGDFMSHMQKQGRLPEGHVRFYAAEICLALNFLHNKGIIYRDLKLDNVLLGSDGHIKLTNYGMCKEGLNLAVDKTRTFCGTPNYIAPEIIQGLDYGSSVDWWALGVLMYEMLAVRSPFDRVTPDGDWIQISDDDLFQVIMEKPILIPKSFSVRAVSVIKGFLNKVPNKRLGCSPQDGFNEILSHPFFSTIDWKLLENKRFPPPYKPSVKSDRDMANFDAEFTNEPVQLTPDDPAAIHKINQSEFEGFEYINHGRHQPTAHIMNQENSV